MNWQPSIGAVIIEGKGVHFRVWAPERQRVEVVLRGKSSTETVHPLTQDADGYWFGTVTDIGHGALYSYRLDGEIDRPDPASRYQPQGVHGPSMVIDPSFPWTDDGWAGVPMSELIIYEMHVGTATPAGTFTALIDKLPAIKDLGVTAIELLPVADFPGRWNWGYDGVDLYAPSRAYGTPHDLRRLVNKAHEFELAVFMDVVYNHFGPSGNYLRDFSAGYFTNRHHTPWGDAINYDSQEAKPVRTFIIENALHWLHEYHIDGLRLDATQEIADDSEEHILAEMVRRVNQSRPPGRHYPLIAEDPRNAAFLARPQQDGGFGMDGIWADDFCHIVRVTLTQERDGYLYAYHGGSQELATALSRGWLWNGEPDPKLGTSRGEPGEALPGSAFIYNIQNHDQAGNRPFGERLNQIISPEAYRAVSVLLLATPYTPLLFMGQEWAASTPFLFFTDHGDDIGPLVSEGRRKEYEHFASFQTGEIPDPQDPASFTRSKLNWEEIEHRPHALVRRLYQDLLALRTNFGYANIGRDDFHATQAGENAVWMRLNGREFTSDEKQKNGEEQHCGEQLLVWVGLSDAARLDLSKIDPTWVLTVDSEDVRYGGKGSFSNEGQPATPSTGSPDETDSLHGPRALIWRQGRQRSNDGEVKSSK